MTWYISAECEPTGLDAELALSRSRGEAAAGEIDLAVLQQQDEAVGGAVAVVSSGIFDGVGLLLVELSGQCQGAPLGDLPTVGDFIGVSIRVLAVAEADGTSPPAVQETPASVLAPEPAAPGGDGDPV